MRLAEVVDSIDTLLRKTNRDLFNNRIDFKSYFRDVILSEEDLEMKTIVLSLDDYNVSVSFLEELDTGLFRCEFNSIVDDYSYSSYNLEDFVEHIKDYIPYSFLESIGSKTLENSDYVLYKN